MGLVPCDPGVPLLELHRVFSRAHSAFVLLRPLVSVLIVAIFRQLIIESRYEGWDAMFFVYVYFTDGLQNWARCFLKSFRFFNGSKTLIVAETRDLSTETQECLKQLYPNLELRNRPLDMSAMAKMAQTTIETLQRWKGEVEHQVTTDENFPWKNLVSTVDRYRSLLPILNEFEDRGFTRMLHSDVDAYFRRGVGSIDEMIAENDACLYFTRKGIWGGLLSLNATEGTKAFLADWRERIIECLSPRCRGVMGKSPCVRLIALSRRGAGGAISQPIHAPFRSRKLTTRIPRRRRTPTCGSAIATGDGTARIPLWPFSSKTWSD